MPGWIAAHIAPPRCVEFIDGVMDRAAQRVSVSKGLMRHMVRLEVVAAPDVVEFRRIPVQPPDGEPVGAVSQRILSRIPNTSAMRGPGPARQCLQHGPRPVRLSAIARVGQCRQRGALFAGRRERRLSSCVLPLRIGSNIESVTRALATNRDLLSLMKRRWGSGLGAIVFVDLPQTSSRQTKFRSILHPRDPCWHTQKHYGMLH